MTLLKISLLFIILICNCSKKEDIQTLFYSSSTVLNSNQESLKPHDNIYNNSIITTIENCSLYSSASDINILLEKGSKIGLFQNDSTINLFLYNGKVKIDKYPSIRTVVINSKNRNQFSLSSGNIIIHTNDTSLSVSTTTRGSVISNDSLFPGEQYYSSLSKNETIPLTESFLDSSIQWLDSMTYKQLESFYIKPGNFPTLKPIIKEAYLNTKLSIKLLFNKRHRNDQITIVNYKIPKDAKLEKNRIVWKPKKTGKYKFSFTISDGTDTNTTTSYIQIKSSLLGIATANVNYESNSKSLITFDLSNISSTITGHDGIEYKIVGSGSDEKWTSSKNPQITTSGTGFKTYTIIAKALNEESFTTHVKVKLDLPPTITFAQFNNEYYLNKSLALDLTNSKDDFSNNLNVTAKIDVNGTPYKSLSFNTKEKKMITLDRIGRWSISFVMNDDYGLETSKKVSFQVFQNLYVHLERSYTTNVNSAFSTTVPLKGQKAKAAYYEINGETYTPTITNNEIKIKATIDKEGEYPLTVTLIDKNDNETKFTTTLHVLNMIGDVTIKVSTKDLWINKPILFEAITKEVDNKITKINWDYNSDGLWDKETIDGRTTTYTYKRRGKYTVTCEMVTNDGNKVRNYLDIRIKNTAPVITAQETIILTKAQNITLQAKATDKENNELFFSWDLNNDGIFETPGETITPLIDKYCTVKVKVMDSDSLYSIDSTKIVLCPNNMRLVTNGAYCIDTYEYPNKKGVDPFNNINYYKAEELCKSQGKRLCYTQEWENACKGKFNLRFSYGNEFDNKKCNTYSGESKITYSGDKEDCKGFYGTYSQNGNLAEWTKSSDSKSYVYGGSYFSNEKNSACDSKVLMEKDKKLPYVGFRCCK